MPTRQRCSLSAYAGHIHIRDRTQASMPLQLPRPILPITVGISQVYGARIRWKRRRHDLADHLRNHFGYRSR